MSSSLSRHAVDLTAALLAGLAGRQHDAGTYGGDDRHRGDRVDLDRAWRCLVTAGAPVDGADAEAVERWERFAGDPAGAFLDRLCLDDAERLVVAVTTALELAPGLGPFVACLTDAPSLRHATVGVLDAAGRLLGWTPLTVRQSLAPVGRLAALQLVRFGAGATESFADRVVLPDEWLFAAVAHGGPRRPVDRALSWWVGKPGGQPLPTEGPTLCADPDPGVDATTWASLDELPAIAAVTLARRPPDAGPWDTEPMVVAAARQCLVERAGLLVQTAATDSWSRPSCESLADLGVPVALHDPAAATLPVPEGWRRLPGRRAPLLDRSRAGAPAAWDQLAALAVRSDTAAGWDDLVVAPRTERQLRRLADAIAAHATVMDEWGFGSRPGATGVNVLLNGPSGTGKTLASQVVAAATGLDLWVVDLSRVTDKYLGESEKHLDRVLTAAAGCGAMLLFDEAEALFGRRGETHEARDRWANMEVSFLLARIERHPGVTVLATNLGHQLDVAFERRIAHRIDFTTPGAALRRRLWRVTVPAAAPLADAADLDLVADRFELTGGAIRNAARNAAYAAAGRGGPEPSITLADLVRAVVAELTKSGRAPTRSELGPLAELLDGEDLWVAPG